MIYLQEAKQGLVISDWFAFILISINYYFFKDERRRVWPEALALWMSHSHQMKFYQLTHRPLIHLLPGGRQAWKEPNGP